MAPLGLHVGPTLLTKKHIKASLHDCDILTAAVAVMVVVLEG